MKRIQIIKHGTVTNEASFPTEEAANEWLARHEGMKTFGTPKHTIQVEVKPAVLDEDGNVIEEAEYEQQEVAGDYEVKIEDLTQQLELDAKVKKEQRDNLKAAANRVKAVDPSKLTTIAALRPVVLDLMTLVNWDRIETEIKE
jgi:hypothetical protein